MITRLLDERIDRCESNEIKIVRIALCKKLFEEYFDYYMRTQDIENRIFDSEGYIRYRGIQINKIDNQNQKSEV